MFNINELMIPRPYVYNYVANTRFRNRHDAYWLRGFYMKVVVNGEKMQKNMNRLLRKKRIINREIDKDMYKDLKNYKPVDYYTRFEND